MSDFTRWSQWFACGLDMKQHKASLADEIGLTPEEGKAAVDALIAEGLVAAVGQETSDLLVVRAVV